MNQVNHEPILSLSIRALSKHGQITPVCRCLFVSLIPPNCVIFMTACLLSISVKEHLDHILSFVKLHWYGITNMQMLNSGGFKPESCCSICGQAQCLMCL